MPVEDEGSILRTLAEDCPTLKELRAANPEGAKAFLAHTKNQPEKWPVEGLIEGYLDSKP